jgi:hypothetical protein
VEELYDFLCFARECTFWLWCIACFWIALNHKKIYRHINNSAFIRRFDWMVKARRRSLLTIAFLPPWSPFSLLFIFLWYSEWSDVKRYRWDLTYQRIRLKWFEKEVFEKEGIDGLIKMSEEVIKDIGEHINQLDTGSPKYNLWVNLYIKCQRRLLKMKQGKPHGHFPIPE